MIAKIQNDGPSASIAASPGLRLEQLVEIPLSDDDPPDPFRGNRIGDICGFLDGFFRALLLSYGA
jgi:hypothetical protein